MTEVLNTVAPVFGLIALGYLAARLSLLDEAADRGLASFVFTIAMPALLFRTMATIAPVEGRSFDLLAAFLASAAVTWIAATVMTRTMLARPFADTASVGMGATFGNTVMMGIPLAVGHFGDEAIAPLAVVVAVHAPAMWIVATFQQEAAARDTGRTLGVMVRDVGVMLVRNPILIGIIGGTLWRTTGVAIPTIPLTIIDYLAAAGIPGALFALGLSLVRYRITGQTATLIAMSLLKLLVMPAVAWLAGVYIFDLPALWLGVAVILAACPTGANAYLFAARYERAVGSVSGSVALTTLLSLVTITALLSVLPK